MSLLLPFDPGSRIRGQRERNPARPNEGTQRIEMAKTQIIGTTEIIHGTHELLS